MANPASEREPSRVLFQRNTVCDLMTSVRHRQPNCFVRKRINKNNHVVYDVHMDKFPPITIVMWDDNEAEVIHSDGLVNRNYFVFSKGQYYATIVNKTSGAMITFPIN